MKNLITLLLILFVLISAGSYSLFAQGAGGDERAWSRITVDPNAPQNVETKINWVPADQTPRFYNLGTGIIVSPNYRPHPTTNTTQSEMSVDVHPTNENIIFASVNATPWPVSAIWGTGLYWSLDGSASWTGVDNPTPLLGGTNGGDPASVIGPNGYFYEGYLVGGSYSLGIAVSTNNGTSWTTHSVYSVASQDKEHVMVDKEPTSPYVNRVYYPWSDLNGSEAALVYSTDFGTTWSSYKNLSGTITPLSSAFAQGPNVQTGPNGEVYVCYAIYDANWTDGEDAIGFSKSTDGGNTWTALRAYNQVNFGVRSSGLPPKNLRTNSFPSMAVDRSGGSNDGNIYICWPQRAGVAPAGTDPDVVLIKSTDGGATWSAPVRVNDDPMSNGKDQLFPWCTVDQSTGQLMLVFYDSRNVVNTQAEVYMARSVDGGNTFENFLVSDHSFALGPIPGFSGNYAGDYIGLAAYNDIAYPYWMDVSTGVAQGWMSTVSFGPPCPIDPVSNPSPANGTIDVPISGNALTWTNGIGANQIEVWFGETGNLVQRYVGPPISSLSLTAFEPLDYSTTYSWQIISMNDTCDVNGPLWAFTTIPDPNIVIETVFCEAFEGGLAGWTVTNDGGTSGCVWQIRFAPFPNTYTLPPSSTGGIMAADVDECGSGTTLLSTATLNQTFDLSVYTTTVWIEFDNDWNVIGAQDEAHVEVSTNGGTSWVGVWDKIGTDISNTHEVVDITSIASGQSNVKFRLRSVQPGWDWWWVLDNFCIYGEYSVPVELTSFTANAVKDGIELNWITATETNNQGFNIERKNSVGVFEDIGYVAGFGTTTEPKSYSYIDSKLETGNYTYRLKQIDFDGSYEYSNEVNVVVELPMEYSLDQNYPNPFNPSTTIKYSIAEDGFVKLAIYNMLGEEVTTLVNTTQKAGKYEVNFNASNLASGVYVYRIESANFNAVKKLMLMK